MKVTQGITHLVIALSIACSGIFACPTCMFLKERSALAEQETLDHMKTVGEMEHSKTTQLANLQEKATQFNKKEKELSALLAVQDIKPVLDKDLDLMDGIDDNDRDIVPGLSHEKK